MLEKLPDDYIPHEVRKDRYKNKDRLFLFSLYISLAFLV